MFEKIFRLKSHETTVRKEFYAGLITFLTMAYILVVNPIILSDAGMDKEALFTATALAAIAGTLFMAFIANVPIALAPGMGLNSFFAVTVVQMMGYSWQFALTAVFIEGLIFILLTAFNVRELIVNSIPKILKQAIPVGIGLFITFIGLHQAGIIVKHDTTMVGLGSFADKGVWVSLAGLFLIGAMLARNVRGAMLVGIFVSTILGIFFGVTAIPDTHLFSIPPDISPVFGKFEWQNVFSVDMLIVVFTFLFVNLFDTIGTLIGVLAKANLMNEKGEFPGLKKALFADALGTTVGAVIGVSPCTAYVESASGVAAGGRTGLTAVFTALMFAIALFLSPIFLMVPVQATAPALIIVGLMMFGSVVDVNFKDFTESLPAFLTIIMMPFTYSIAYGIIFGMLSFVFVKLLSTKHKDIKPAVYVIAVLFLLKIVLDVIS